MSLPIASTGPSSALPALNVHSHGHGHKKGLESATDLNGSDTDSPTGSTQSLFSNLLTSMEQVIGTKPANSSAQAGRPVQAVSVNSSAPPAAASSAGNAAKMVLGTIGSALHFFA